MEKQSVNPHLIILLPSKCIPLENQRDFQKLKTQGKIIFEILYSQADNFYNLPEVRMKRSTTLGKGCKYDFTLGQKGIHSQFLNYKSDFDRANPNSPCYTFGVGRDKYAKVYIESAKMIDLSVPGPGQYNILKTFGSQSNMFTIKGKNVSKTEGKTSLPGPGSYKNCLGINERGKYPLSKISNIAEVNFDGSNPGPSDYNKKPLMGFIFDSRFRSSPSRSIYAKYKDVDSRINYPGPGEYKAFSEFGIYESKYAKSLPTDFNTKKE